MKIAIYSISYDETGGGGITYLLQIANILLEANNEVHLFFNKTVDLGKIKSVYTIDKVALKHISKISIPILGQLIFAAKEQRKYDIVIQQSLYSPRITFVKKSFILCDFPFEKIDSINKKIRLNTWKHIITNSYFTKKWIKNYWKKEAFVIHPPIQVQNNVESKTEKEINLVSVGRFNRGSRSKRQDLICDVFKKIIDKSPVKLNLHLIGFTQDKKFIEELKSRSKGYPIFFHENCAVSQRNELLKTSHIFISATGFNIDETTEPNNLEHYGISVVEAMSLGCVPVVIGKGGHLETVDHNVNGFHWEALDELEAILINLVSNQKTINKLSERSIQKSKKYSIDSERIEVLNKILN